MSAESIEPRGMTTDELLAAHLARRPDVDVVTPWLATGGALYTLGIAFYATDHKLRHGHGIWHLFVLAGSICHFFTLLLYVA